MNKPLLVDNFNIAPKKEYIVVTKHGVIRERFLEILKSHDIDVNIDYLGHSFDLLCRLQRDSYNND